MGCLLIYKSKITQPISNFISKGCVIFDLQISRHLNINYPYTFGWPKKKVQPVQKLPLSSLRRSSSLLRRSSLLRWSRSRVLRSRRSRELPALSFPSGDLVLIRSVICTSKRLNYNTSFKTCFFDTTIPIYNFPHAHTNWKGYFVSKNRFLTQYLSFQIYKTK